MASVSLDLIFPSAVPHLHDVKDEEKLRYFKMRCVGINRSGQRPASSCCSYCGRQCL